MNGVEERNQTYRACTEDRGNYSCMWEYCTTQTESIGRCIAYGTHDYTRANTMQEKGMIKNTTISSLWDWNSSIQMGQQSVTEKSAKSFSYFMSILYNRNVLHCNYSIAFFLISTRDRGEDTRHALCSKIIVDTRACSWVLWWQEWHIRTTHSVKSAIRPATTSPIVTTEYQ